GVRRGDREEFRGSLARRQWTTPIRTRPAGRTHDPSAIGDGLAERIASESAHEDVAGGDGHGGGARGSIAARRDQPEVREAHVLHRTSDGSHVARILRTDEDDANALEAHASPGFGRRRAMEVKPAARIDSTDELS